jgi:hypothetical protein
VSNNLQRVTGLDLYKVALETRNLEISLFWQRSNYFLVLNTAIAAGFLATTNHVYSILLAAAGLCIAFLWFRVNLGGKFWQSRWEQALSDMEQMLHTDIRLFSASWEAIEHDVRRSLEGGRHGWLRRLFDKLVLQKPSVTFAMTLVSLVFVVFWSAALVLAVHKRAF